MAEAPLPLPGGGWFALRGGAAAPVAAPPRPPRAAPPAPAPSAPPASRRRASGLDTLHLALGGVALAVPAALAEHIHPMPALLALPGAPAGVAGLAHSGGAPILVLDTGFVGGGSGMGDDAAPALLLALGWQGRRIGLPAQRIAAGPEVPALRLFHAWLASPAAAAALACAPPALAAMPVLPVPERHLVLFRAGGLRAALPVEAVRAVLAATRPQPLPGADPRPADPTGTRHPHGFAAHRGEVLPVRDAGQRLSGQPCWTTSGAPMIRLGLGAEVLLAVQAIEGVRCLPAADITPLGGGHGMEPARLVAAVARWQGESLLVLSPAALAA